MSHFASVTYRDNFPASLPATCRQKRYMFKPHNTISRTCFMAQQMHIVHSDFIEYDNVTIRKPSKKVVSPDGFEAFYKNSKKWYRCTAENEHFPLIHFPSDSNDWRTRHSLRCTDEIQKIVKNGIDAQTKFEQTK